MGYCTMLGCNSGTGKGRISGNHLYNIPALITNQCRRSCDVSRRRRSLWLERINREELYTRKGEMRVCGLHFVKGKPAKWYEEHDVDWAPSLKLGYSLKDKESVRKMKRRKSATTASLQNQRNQRLQTSKNALQEGSRSLADSSASVQENSCLTESDTKDNVVFIKQESMPPVPLLNGAITKSEEPSEEMPHSTCVGITPYGSTTSQTNQRLQTPDGSQEGSLSFAGSSTMSQGNYFLTESYMRGHVIIIKQESMPPLPLLNGAVTTSEEPPEEMPHSTCVGNAPCGGTTTQTDLSGRDVELLLEKCARLEKELKEKELFCRERHTLLNNDNESQRDELLKMAADLNKVHYVGSFPNDDAKVECFTGLPTLNLLKDVYSFVESSVNELSNSLSKFSEFLIVMMHLHMGLPDLACRFKVSAAMESTTIDKWLPKMAVRLSSKIVWPDRATLRATMPDCFQKAFGGRVAVIADYFEISVDTSSSLVPRGDNGRVSVKFLIGITPRGSVCFVSRGWSGESTDNITLSREFLYHLAPGDVVLANKSFTGEVDPNSTKLETLKSSEDLGGTNITNVKAHVERTIGFIREKFRILSRVLPISSLTPRRIEDDAPIDCIVKICCALANLHPPIVERKNDCPEETVDSSSCFYFLVRHE